MAVDGRVQDRLARVWREESVKRATFAGLLAALLCAAFAGCQVDLGSQEGVLSGRRKHAERVQHSPEWAYGRAYAAWQVNHQTAVDEAEQSSYSRNNLLIKTAADDAGWALRTMKAHLPEGKGKELDPIVEGYQKLGQWAMEKVSSTVLLSRLRSLERQVVNGFSPDIVPIVPPREE
jgi:signal transduction protein with GAF and PtsI domain